MTPDSLDLDRRTVLKGLGGAATVGAVGGGSLVLTGGAAAQAQFDATITDTTLSNDQGDLDWLGVSLDKTISWDGFDVPVAYIGFTHDITIQDSGSTPWHTLYDMVSDKLTNWSSKGSGSDGWGGPGEYVSTYTGDKSVDGLKGEAHADVKWAVISDGSHPSGYESVQTPVDWTSRLSAGEDGTTESNTLKWRTTLTFYEDNSGSPSQIAESDGVPEVEATETFDVAVTNEDSSITSTSSGGSTAG